VLSRELAQRGHHPAIDVLRSVSRLLPDLATPAEQQCALATRGLLALLERHRAMVEIGAYVAGSRPELDRALAREPALQAFLSQDEGGVPRAVALQALGEALGGSA
jgi:flagellum-specific ATP synthase